MLDHMVTSHHPAQSISNQESDATGACILDVHHTDNRQGSIFYVPKMNIRLNVAETAGIYQHCTGWPRLFTLDFFFFFYSVACTKNAKYISPVVSTA